MTGFLIRHSLKVSLLMALLLFLLCLGYIFSIDLYTLGGDQMRWVELIEKMYQGQFNWPDLWDPHGGHRAPAYKAIFLANARFFGLNMQLEQVLGAMAWAGAAVVATIGLARHFDRNTMGPATALVLIATPFIVMNGQILQTVLSYSVISLRMLDMMCFFIIFMLLSRNLIREPACLDSLKLVVLMALCSLFIGRGWGQAMLATVFFVLVAYTVLNMRELTRDRILKTLLPPGAGALVFVYLYKMGIESKVSALGNLLDLSSLITFVLTLLGRTLTFQHIRLESGVNLLPILAVGGSIAAIYALAIYLFFVTKQYHQGWFPFCLMVFSLVAVLCVYLGRGVGLGGGWQAGLFPRHLPECSVGLAGALTCIAFAVKQSRYWVAAVATLCIILVASQSVAIIKTVSHSNYMANYADSRAGAFFGPISAFSDEAVVKLARCHSEELCIYVRGVVDHYGLMKQGRHRLAHDAGNSR
jgi:hypothetical protein